MIYTKFEIPVRGVRYRADGKLVSVRDVPVEELARLNEDVSVEREPRSCLFCGGPARYQRLVELQTIDICDQHYYSETVGSIVHKMKELSNAQSQS